VKLKPKIGDIVRQKEFSGCFVYGLVLDVEDAKCIDPRCTVVWFKRVKTVGAHWAQTPLDKINVSESLTYSCTLEVFSGAP